jgi:hypothetical protein
MSADTVIVAAIVLGAVAFLLRRAIRTRKAGHGGGSGCDNCGH